MIVTHWCTNILNEQTRVGEHDLANANVCRLSAVLSHAWQSAASWLSDPPPFDCAYSQALGWLPADSREKVTAETTGIR